MKRYVFFTLMISCFIRGEAQHKAGIFVSQDFSSFRFRNSENLADNPGYTVKFGYGVLIQNDIGDNAFLEGSLAYRNKGAASQVDLTKLEWSFHYINAGINAGYRFDMGRFRPVTGAGVYYGRVLKADQYIGSDYFNLMSGNLINKNDLGATVFAGMEYRYSVKFRETGNVFIRLNESVGLLNLEDYKNVKQKMFNMTFSIQAGTIFTFN